MLLWLFPQRFLLITLGLIYAAGEYEFTTVFLRRLLHVGLDNVFFYDQSVLIICEITALCETACEPYLSWADASDRYDQLFPLWLHKLLMQPLWEWFRKLIYKVDLCWDVSHLNLLVFHELPDIVMFYIYVLSSCMVYRILWGAMTAVYLCHLCEIQAKQYK